MPSPAMGIAALCPSYRTSTLHRELANKLGIVAVNAIALSALQDDSLAHRSNRTLWYRGPTLPEILEQVRAIEAANGDPVASDLMPDAYKVRATPP